MWTESSPEGSPVRRVHWEGLDRRQRGKSGVAAAGTQPMEGVPLHQSAPSEKCKFSSSELGAPGEETGWAPSPRENTTKPRAQAGNVCSGCQSRRSGQGRAHRTQRPASTDGDTLSWPPTPSVSKYRFACGRTVTVDSSCCSVFAFSVLTWPISSWHPMTGTKVDFLKF